MCYPCLGTSVTHVSGPYTHEEGTHSPSSLSIFTLHLHSPSSLSIFTLHLHSPSSLSIFTLHLHSSSSIFNSRLPNFEFLFTISQPAASNSYYAFPSTATISS